MDKDSKELDKIYHILPDWVHRCGTDKSLSERIQFMIEQYDTSLKDIMDRNQKTIDDDKEFRQFLLHHFCVEHRKAGIVAPRICLLQTMNQLFDQPTLPRFE